MLHKLHSLHKLHPVGVGGNKNNKIDTISPTISLKDNSEVAEVEKATQIEFLISGESRWGKNDLIIELLNENKELSFSTKKWTNMDYGFTLLTKVTSKKEVILKYNLR